MREMDEGWAERRRIHNERAITRAVFVVALLVVGAEICGCLGIW